MSRPHSGSTILDILIGSSGQVAGCGEIIMGLEHDYRTWRCSCGQLMPACPVWSEVHARLAERDGIDWEEFAAASVEQAHKGSLLATWRADPAREGGDRRFGKLAELTRKFATAIGEVTQRPIVLDSTKMPGRALFLLKFLPETRVIHMVRDPRNVLASHWWRFKINDTYLAQKRPYRGPLAPLAWVEAAMMWLMGNIVFELIARSAPDRVLRVRYEDLRDRPVDELRRLGVALGLDLSDVIARVEQGATFESGHMAGGNPVRHEGAVRFEAGRERTRERPPQALLVLTSLLCWPLMLRYGYALRPSAIGRTVRPAPAVRGAS